MSKKQGAVLMILAAVAYAAYGAWRWIVWKMSQSIAPKPFWASPAFLFSVWALFLVSFLLWFWLIREPGNPNED